MEGTGGAAPRRGLRVGSIGLDRVGREWITDMNQDRVTGLSAEVAFYGVLSIFPGLLIIASALGSLDALVGGDYADSVERVVIDFLNRILTESATQPISATEQLFREGRGGILTLSIIAAVYSLTRGFAAVIRALDLAYDLPEARHWFRQRMVAMALGLGSLFLAMVMMVAFVAGPLLGGGEALTDALGVDNFLVIFWNYLRWPVTVTALALWATTIYHLAPNHSTTWRRDLPGGIFAALGWLVVSLGFSLYLRLASSANEVLGVLGGGLILLVWIYLLSLVLLAGGELNAAILRVRSNQEGPGP